MTTIPRLLFGTAGIPLSTPNRDTLNGIAHIKTLGLDSMELEFVRSINISTDKAPIIKEHANQAGACSICSHMAYYMKPPPAQVYEKVKHNVKQIVKQLQDTSNPIWLRPETGGKINQFADIDDLIRLSQDVR